MWGRSVGTGVWEWSRGTLPWWVRLAPLELVAEQSQAGAPLRQKTHNPPRPTQAATLAEQRDLAFGGLWAARGSARRMKAPV